MTIAEFARPIVALSVIGWVSVGLMMRRPSPRLLAIVLVGFLWVGVGILAIDGLASQLGWWTYAGDPPRFMATPVDVLLVWALVWAALPVVLTGVVRPVPTAALFLIVDLLVVPRLNMVVALHPGWLVGELVLVAVVALPALYLMRWMQRSDRLHLRTGMLLILFTILMFAIVPMLASRLTGTAIDPPWGTTALIVWLQVIGVPALVGLAAVIELATRGGGTPYPWDGPTRVVSTGPYAYVANPMQLSMVVILPLLAALLWHWPTLVAGTVAIAFSIGLASHHEKVELENRWGVAWLQYRGDHRAWVPLWQPRFTATVDAVLYVDFDCGPCLELGAWIKGRDPVGLHIVPATEYPGDPLWRATYERGDYSVDGVRAIATALEHLHLGWAWIGWFLRLPIIWRLAQLVSDVTGNMPHEAGVEACSAETPRPQEIEQHEPR